MNGEQKSWPFQEARKLLKRVKGKSEVIFQTGYGPSGLPHIGTFGEVARTTMVMNAFRAISDIPVKLIVFSDDLDALRKAPENVPNQEMLNEHIGVPLTSVPDPFGEYDSFADHNNAKLCEFLDMYGFEYEFKSSTEQYQSGVFNETLKYVADNVDKILQVILPTFKDERKATYCPFLPIANGVMHMEVYDWYISPSTDCTHVLFWKEKNGICHATQIVDGQVKLQWKVDWAMRWMAYDVDYEMHGKDLIDSAKLSDIFCRRLDRQPPLHMVYELFLDEQGRKISKSLGNGVDIGEWWKYGTKEALLYYMFQNPKRARKLFFGVIPQMTDDYLKSIDAFNESTEQCETDFDIAAWHIYNGKVPSQSSPVSFTMLLNLVSITNTDDPAVVLRYVRNYVGDIAPWHMEMLDTLIQRAINYYTNKILPTKEYREPTDDERVVLRQLIAAIESTDGSEKELTYEIYEVGKSTYTPEGLRDFFQMVYEVLMGQKSGPRLPVFVLLYGVENTLALLQEKL